VRIIAQERTTLTFRHSTPDPEFDAVVKGVRAALDRYRAMTADGGCATLGGTADEECIGITVPAFGLGHPFPPICLLHKVGGGCFPGERVVSLLSDD
jgi:hypothetical protein